MRNTYLIEGIAKKSETQAFRRYTEYKQKQGETDIDKIKKEFLTFRDSLRTDISYLRNNDKERSVDGGKYEEGCTRLFLDDELNSNENIRSLNNIIGVILKDINLYKEYDKNLNDLSLDELKDGFQETLQQVSDNEQEEIEKLGYSNKSDSYDIIPINSFEEAKKYYPYCIHISFNDNNNKPEWCLTYGESHFMDYSSGGVNQIYFCLKRGISEKDDPVKGDGHPQDEYGNSMISVIVDENGKLAYSTSRWNHEKGGNDQCYSVVDISRIIGVDFYKTFLPNNRFQDSLKNALTLYNKNGDLKGFDGYESFNEKVFKVKLLGKWNFINTEDKKLVNDIWVNDIDYPDEEGFTSVELNSKWNFINQDGEIVSDKWYDNVFNFNDGFSPIKLKDKYSFINTKGEPITDKWYDMVYDFSNGLGSVQLNDKWNFINDKGEVISNIWFDITLNFKDDKGFAKVGLYNKGWFKIDKYGNLYDENDNLVNKGNISKGNANESLKKEYRDTINEVKSLIKRINKY